MANLKVKLKRRNGIGFDNLYPEITPDQILQPDGSALSTFSSELLVASQDGSNITFITADSDGGFNLRTASNVLGDFSIASASYATGQCSLGSQYDNDFEGCLSNGGTFIPVADHNQAQSTIYACYTIDAEGVRRISEERWTGDTAFDAYDSGDQSACETPTCSDGESLTQSACEANNGTWWAGGTWTPLNTALGYKATLSGTKLQLTELPLGVNIVAMKYKAVTGNLGTSSSPANLSSVFSHLDNVGVTGLTQLRGDYFIATPTGTNTFIQGDTSARGDVYQFLLGDDEDDTQDYTGKIEIESGDRLVFSHFTGSGPGSYTLYFSVINTVNSPATDALKGIVSLSSTGQTLSGFRDITTDRHNYAVDEASLRDAMKDQRRIIEFTGHTGTSKQIHYYAALASNLPSSGVTAGERALVGTGTSKDVYEYIASSWQDTLIDATFPTNAATIPSAGTQDAKDLVFYDAVQLDYLYVSSTQSNYSNLTKEPNNESSTILPVDGDLVYWISP